MDDFILQDFSMFDFFRYKGSQYQIVKKHHFCVEVFNLDDRETYYMSYYTKVNKN